MGSALVTMGPAGAAMLLALAGSGIEPGPPVAKRPDDEIDEERLTQLLRAEQDRERELQALLLSMPRVSARPAFRAADLPRHGKRAQRRRAKGW